MKVIPITQAGNDSDWVSLFEAQKKIYPRSSSGIFTSLRWAFVWVTQMVFYGLPWLEWGQRQSVLFDLSSRRFHIFGLTLYPQDFIYLTGLLVMSALALFLFTAVAGRLWCGFACPQTVYTEVFLFIERKFEGDRSSQMRRDKQPWSMQKFSRKFGKHVAWLSLALWTGFTFVGYFTPIRDLLVEVIELNLGSWEMFWVGFYGLATYGNAGYMREQVCKYMCPYARFQSAMFDKDTLIVSYDQGRGEPRGRGVRSGGAESEKMGDCVDCTLCVQVCPTGIDIRRGLQYECIGCGACADICDSVMDKLKFNRGLIRFSTQNAVVNRWSGGQILKRVFRTRILIYSTVLLLLSIAIAFSLLSRSPFRVDITRDRSALARVVAGGKVENVYRVHLTNTTASAQTYTVSIRGAPWIQVVGEHQTSSVAYASQWLVVHLQTPLDRSRSGAHSIQLVVTEKESGYQSAEKTVFFVPK